MPAPNPKKRVREAHSKSSFHSGPPVKKVKTIKAKATTERAAKRSKPVTVATSKEEASENTDNSDEEEADDNFDAEADLDAGQADELMQVDEPSASSGQSARESHLAQKALTQSRKAAKPHSELIAEAKRVWALARSKDKNLTAGKRKEYVEELMRVVKGKIKDIVFKHDASRIIQTLVKYGSKSQREEIADELKGSYVDLAKNRYAKFLLLKLIRLLPSRRSAILSSFHGHILGRNSSKSSESNSGGLLLHREASGVLADAFELYANSAERAGMVKEFYGKEVALFGKEGKDGEKRGLVGVIEGLGSDKEKKKRILGAAKENLDLIFNNPDKGAVRHAIVHRAVWEYLEVLGSMQDLGNTEETTEAEKLRRDLFENCSELIAEIVHTKDGSRVAREFLARGSAKDRKTILKSLKPHLTRMCLDDEAQMVLFTAIDVIDDTKLVLKSLSSHITSPAVLSELIVSAQGRRAILYLLVPRSRRHFTVAQINSLAETDGIISDIQDKDGKVIREGTSKKSAGVRKEEVRKGASEGLLKWIEEQGPEVIKDPAGTLVVGDIILYSDGDKSSASKALLKPLASPYPRLPPTQHAIDLPHTSRLYKTLLQGGHFNHASKAVEEVEGWDAGAFAVHFVESVSGEDGEGVKSLCTKGERNGAFVVAELCGALVRASSTNAEVKQAREKVKAWLSGSEITDEIKEGEKSGAKGVKVLLDAIAAL
ncbi:hypothetical protein GYMLUDRAFT_40159 [Collybiopsis luxurians FD-317 M1]|uniref:PUM-HD domain-containing protein n=1 Tax=Collybiopsis luxurians FD-317 M1 TaxID=944289 RepID=A0A0D0CLR7_9AGAR|nr:hypothetical protein GYMLUDRAFT_40159 [Collybiopsis luxurians FD-317 M1]